MLLLILKTLGLNSVFSSPIDDLASPLQNIRDKAAEELRKSYHRILESKWTPTIETIKVGQTKIAILELLRPFNVTQEGGMGSGQTHSESYRLDNEWILICWYQNKGDILIDRKLIRSINRIWIDPPKKFTGKWITYFVNGEKSQEISYRAGQYFGEWIGYHSDGSKNVVQHYSETGANGDDTGYYPSGKIQYRAQYKDDKPVGTWTWYDESGNITSTQENPGSK